MKLFKRSIVVATAAVIGLVAVPSLVADSRNRGSSDSNNSTNQQVQKDDSDTRKAGINTDTSSSSDSSDDGNRSSSNSNGGNTANSSSSQSVTNGEKTSQEAQAIAKNLYPGKTVKKVELEHEHGAKVYSVRFTDDTRVDVRANDGQIVRNESGGDNNRSDGSSNNDNSGRDHPEDN